MATDTVRERVIAERDRIMAEVVAAFLGGGDEPATWAVYAFDAGRKAGYAEGLEDAAKKAESVEDIWNAGKDWNSACNAVATAIRDSLTAFSQSAPAGTGRKDR